jgi:hypothetical protein
MTRKSKTTNKKQLKGNMQEKTKTKKEKSEIKVRDLKPVKDPKAGTPPGPCGPGRRSPSRMPTAVE